VSDHPPKLGKELFRAWVKIESTIKNVALLIKIYNWFTFRYVPKLISITFGVLAGNFRVIDVVIHSVQILGLKIIIICSCSE